MNIRARVLSALLSLALLVVGLWPLLRPLTSLESWLPRDRLIIVAHDNAASDLVFQILQSPQLQARAIVLPSSSAAATLASESCAQLAPVLSERHPSFRFIPESFLCHLVRKFADDLLATDPNHGRDIFLFEGFSPVPHGLESEAWRRYGLEGGASGLVVVGRGRRPDRGPGYNREIGY